jgi:hypothetical protein
MRGPTRGRPGLGSLVGLTRLPTLRRLPGLDRLSGLGQLPTLRRLSGRGRLLALGRPTRRPTRLRARRPGGFPAALLAQLGGLVRRARVELTRPLRISLVVGHTRQHSQTHCGPPVTALRVF